MGIATSTQIIRLQSLANTMLILAQIDWLEQDFQMRNIKAMDQASHALRIQTSFPS